MDCRSEEARRVGVDGADGILPDEGGKGGRSAFAVEFDITDDAVDSPEPDDAPDLDVPVPSFSQVRGGPETWNACCLPMVA